MSNPSFFSEKPFYRPEEIDRMCIDELSKVDLLPTAPEPIRVERFIEKRFNVTPVYEELPEGVLGFIEFCSKGVKGITVSRSLSEEDSIVAERRIKTTLAHEVGHGLLHTHLFILGRNPEPLFDEDINSKKPKILCRNNTIQGIQEVNGSNYS